MNLTTKRGAYRHMENGKYRGLTGPEVDKGSRPAL